MKNNIYSKVRFKTGARRSPEPIGALRLMLARQAGIDGYRATKDEYIVQGQNLLIISIMMQAIEDLYCFKKGIHNSAVSYFRGEVFTEHLKIINLEKDIAEKCFSDVFNYCEKENIHPYVGHRSMNKGLES